MELRSCGLKTFVLTLLLCFGMGARAGNVVTISSVEGAPGDEVTIHVSLQNTDAVSSLQVSIPLDENITLVEGSGQKGSRCSGHSLTVGVKDGVLNIVIYSMSMAAISGSSGKVASFKLKLGNQPQTLTLTPSKTALTNTNGKSVAGTAKSGEVITRCAKAQYSTMEVDFGAVPIRDTYTKLLTVTNIGNADLTITDLQFSDINVFSSTTSLPITIGAGSSKELNITYAPVERGNISKSLKVICNSTSKLNTIKLKAQPFAVNELHIQNVEGISDEELTISMMMNNMDAVSGYQVEFTLPEQLEYVENSFALSSRKQDHTTIVSCAGKTLCLVAYSPTDKPLTGNDGEIGTFKVKLVGRNGTELTPTKTVLSATINKKVENVVSAVYGGQVTINSPQLYGDDVLDYGDVPVTEKCEKTYTIHNYGNAPLTVSRIMFDNENLSVKETLPLTIPAWESKDVTVVYSSVEQKAFDAVMRIYSNDPDLRMKEVQVKGKRFAPNYLLVTTPEVKPTETLRINIAVNTYDAITGMQFDLIYPGEYYEPFDGNVTLESWASGMTVEVRQIDSNTQRYFCYFLSGGGIAAGKGKVMTIQMKPKAGSVPIGTYEVNVKAIKFATSEMADKYAGTDCESSYEVLDYILGDADGDGTVDVNDVTTTINYILKKPYSKFVFSAADVDGDDTIDVNDVQGIIDIALGKTGGARMMDNSPSKAEMHEPQ